MLRTNLSTRPFYNTRAVRAGLGAIAVIAASLTIFNVVEMWRLQRANRELGQLVNQNEIEGRDLRQKARAVQQAIDKTQLQVVDAAAREANALIDRRAFSWTELLNQFQDTLPPSVRVVSVQPQIDNDGRMLVAITVRSQRQEDLDTFIEAMEKTGVFRDVLSRVDSANTTDGTLVSVLQAYYQVKAPPAITPPAAGPGAEPPADRTTPKVVAGVER